MKKRVKRKCAASEILEIAGLVCGVCTIALVRERECAGRWDIFGRCGSGIDNGQRGKCEVRKRRKKAERQISGARALRESNERVL